MNRYENYVRDQFKRLTETEYGFSVKIFDGLGNTTNTMELTPQKAELILKILKEKKGVWYENNKNKCLWLSRFEWW